MTPRPFLLLDVDGTLSPYKRASLPYPPEIDWREITSMFGDPVVVDARLPAWLERLGALYEIAWATTWGELANELLSEPLGLPPLRVVSVHESTSARRADAKSRHGSDRLPAVLDFIGERRAAWVDDEVTEATVAFGRRRQPPLLVVRTTPHVGLSLAQFEELERFARG